MTDTTPDDPHDTSQDVPETSPDDDSITPALFQLAGLLVRHERRTAHGGGFAVHRGQGRVLALLALRERMSQKELAYLLGVRPQSLGELLAKLERSGLVRRSPDESDRRTWLVELTEEGRAAATDASAVRAQDPFEVLDADERTTLQALLEKVSASLRDAEGDLPGGRGHRHPPFPGGPGFGPGGPGFGPMGPGFGPRRRGRRGRDEDERTPFRESGPAPQDEPPTDGDAPCWDGHGRRGRAARAAALRGLAWGW